LTFAIVYKHHRQEAHTTYNIKALGIVIDLMNGLYGREAMSTMRI